LLVAISFLLHLLKQIQTLAVTKFSFLPKHAAEIPPVDPGATASTTLLAMHLGMVVA
jgi:hypothetical protein